MCYNCAEKGNKVLFPYGSYKSLKVELSVKPQNTRTIKSEEGTGQR